MKSLLSLALVLMFGLPMAHAQNDVPNCWTESGADIEDGQFLVELKTKDMDKTQLIQALSALNGKNIRAGHYPIIFGDMMVITVKAEDFGVGAYKLSRAQLKSTVESELGAILKIPGVSAECDGHMYPTSGFGVHN